MKIRINTQDLSKLLFTIFMLYICWYKESRTDVPVILYGSVLLLTLTCLFSQYKYDGIIGLYKAIHPIVKMFIGLGIYAFISGLIVSEDKSLFLSSMLTYFEFMVVLMDCSIISQKEGSWKWILSSLLIVSLLCMVQTILWGKPYINGVMVTTMSSHNNPNALAHVMIMGMYSLVATRNRAMNHYYLKIIIMLAFLYVIFLTGSRKGILAAGVFMTFWIITILSDRGEKKQTRKLGVLIGIILICTAGYWYLTKYYFNSDRFDRMVKLFSNSEDNYMRTTMYSEGINLWKMSPIFGVGFNQFKIYSQFGYYSHSTYIEVLSCMGIIGCCILFFPIMKYMLYMFRHINIQDPEKKYVTRLSLIAIIVELFLGIGNIWFYGFSHMCFIVAFLGIFDDWRYQDVENNNNSTTLEKTN